jgi:hypothetical protein
MATIKGGHRLQQYLAKLAAKLDQPGTLRVGWLENATAPNGDNLGLRAFRLEFGTSKMPPRPFFRNMIAAKAKEWPAALALNLKQTDYNVKLTLERAGEGIKGQLKESIIDLWAPPLAESTIKRKGFEKPLIEHGDMLNAVAWEVNMGGKVTLSAAGPGAASLASAAKVAVKPKP